MMEFFSVQITRMEFGKSFVFSGSRIVQTPFMPKNPFGALLFMFPNLLAFNPWFSMVAMARI
jgi:hypothetical protein